MLIEIYNLSEYFLNLNLYLLFFFEIFLFVFHLIKLFSVVYNLNLIFVIYYFYFEKKYLDFSLYFSYVYKFLNSFF